MTLWLGFFKHHKISLSACPKFCTFIHRNIRHFIAFCLHYSPLKIGEGGPKKTKQTKNKKKTTVWIDPTSLRFCSKVLYLKTIISINHLPTLVLFWNQSKTIVSGVFQLHFLRHEKIHFTCNKFHLLCIARTWVPRHLTLFIFLVIKKYLIPIFLLPEKIITSCACAWIGSCVYLARPSIVQPLRIHDELTWGLHRQDDIVTCMSVSSI